MSQLTLLKNLIGDVQGQSDEVLEFYLDSAKDIICELRHTEIVEDAYLNTQIRIAIEFFNKRGAEGQTAHSENGIGRTYSKADVSDDLLAKITPMARTPFSTIRVIV